MTAFHVEEYLIVFSSLHTTSSSCSKPIDEQTLRISPLLIFSIFLSISILCILSISLYYKKLKDTEQRIVDPKQNNKPHSLFLEILNSNSLVVKPKQNNEEAGDEGNDKSVGEDCGKNGKKKKKKRGKKKTRVSQSNNGGEEMRIESGVSKQCVDSLYPFTSSSSATQRKIKQQYDQLVKSNASKGLTLAQVGEFVNCLVEARNDLQHKSEIIRRKFTIIKALLLKADRSSFDRLSQQLYKLEAEQKRLEEDASVYNQLQQQLKLSPAYKKMLEIGARMELRTSEDQLIEGGERDFPEISFEELLAQEKKDMFWQKNGKMRSHVN